MSMRTGLDQAPTAHPIGQTLPAVYQEYEFVQQLTAALDEVLAPALLTLDSFAAYLDPHLAPEDFLDWLAGWVAYPLDDEWPLAQRRALVAEAVQLHRWRGTRRGLAKHVELLTGGTVEVVDTGGCGWSPHPGSRLPGTPEPRIEVTVRTRAGAPVDPARIRTLIVDSLPAHVPVTVRAESVAVGRARVHRDQ
jgi:phage tail-like protein